MLTDKQKEVLYGLIKYPSLNDRELSEIIQINKSTIATIKNRFRKSNYYTTIRLPHLDKFGFELMELSYSAMSPFLSRRSKSELDHIFRHFSEITINMFLKSTEGFWQSIAQDFTQAKENNDLILQLDAKYHFLRTNEITTIYFPFRTSRIINYWDYSYALAHLFDQLIPTEDEGTEQPPAFSSIPKEPRTFSELEKKALFGLIKYPEMSDRTLAQQISMSRNTLTAIRHKFEEEELIQRIRVPNFEKLGFGLLVFTHVKLRPKSITQSYKIRELYTSDEILVPDIFSILSETDFISLSVYRNLADFEEVRNKVNRRLRDELYTSREPINLIFSIQDMKVIKEHSYLPIVTRYLGIATNINEQIVDLLFGYVGYLAYYMIYSLRRRLDLLEGELSFEELRVLVQAIKEEIEPLVGIGIAERISKEILQLRG